MAFGLTLSIQGSTDARQHRKRHIVLLWSSGTICLNLHICTRTPSTYHSCLRRFLRRTLAVHKGRAQFRNKYATGAVRVKNSNIRTAATKRGTIERESVRCQSIAFRKPRSCCNGRTPTGDTKLAVLPEGAVLAPFFLLKISLFCFRNQSELQKDAARNYL